jgi:hypothetical protein
MRWWIGFCLGVLLCTGTIGFANDRHGSPFGHEPWEGYRTYRPEHRRGWDQRDWPDRFTIDKPGKCEVRCEYDGRGRYKCREYRC